MCLEIYELDPTPFLTAQGLVWQAALKQAKVNIDLITNVNMLLMIGKGIRGGFCHSIYTYGKANEIL